MKTTVSRRQFAGLAAAYTSLATLLPAADKESLASSTTLKSGGLYKVLIGEYEITAIQDGVVPMQKGFFIGDQEKITKTLEETGQTEELIPAPISAFLLRSKKKTILIDSGMGSIDMMGPGFGNLFNGLLLAGVTPAEIDIVILTHCHPDHIGGMLTSTGERSFPNAEVVLAEAEAKFWTDVSIMNQAPDNMKGLFKFVTNALKSYGDQVTKVSSGKEIAPGIVLQAAPGHTPGHSILNIDGGTQQITMIADLLHNADLFTALPEIGFGFDVDATLAAKTRSDLFAQLASEKSLIMGSHLHFPGIGRILKAGNAYRYSSATV